MDRKMILVFSTARRYDVFKLTINSLIKYNQELINIVDKVYILDDRSTWEDRQAMETTIGDIFGGDKTITVSFNGDGEFDWIDKLNFLGNISSDDEYILFIEDDWESRKSMDIKLHLDFLDENKNIDLITFNGWFNIQNQNNKDAWDYVESYNDIYFHNPYPKGFKHVVSENNGILKWFTVKIDNFSLNPGLYRSNIFTKEKFIKKTNFESEFGEKSKLKQLFVKEGRFIHRGEDTLHDRVKHNPIII
jgi:hypothetical protein